MKIKKLKITISIFSMLLCFTVFGQRQGRGVQGGRSGGVQGQQRGGKPDTAKILSILDTNGDNKIDKNEATQDQRGKIYQDFDQIDTNGDGFIVEDELKASLSGRGGRGGRGVLPEKIMREVDDNKDGKLNQLEIAAKEKFSLRNNFEKIDTNQNNELDLEELKVFYSKGDNKKRKRRKKQRQR